VGDLDKLQEGEILILLKRSSSRISSPSLSASKLNTKAFQGVTKATSTINNNCK